MPALRSPEEQDRTEPDRSTCRDGNDKDPLACLAPELQDLLRGMSGVWMTDVDRADRAMDLYNPEARISIVRLPAEAFPE